MILTQIPPIKKYSAFISHDTNAPIKIFLSLVLKLLQYIKQLQTIHLTYFTPRFFKYPQFIFGWIEIVSTFAT